MPSSNLNGCVNDILNIRDIILKYYNFKIDNVRVVLDERATKQAIMDRLHWLLLGAKPGDNLIFHYSGHGSQIRDRQNDELSDGLDELICPTNMDFNRPDTFIIDDEFKALFSLVPQGVNLEIMLDCCHSGTGTRELMFDIPDSLANPVDKNRYVAPPLDIMLRDSGDLEVNGILKKPSGGVNGDSNPTTHTLFAGCRDNQTSADAFINGTYNGAFTYYLCKNIREAQGKISRTELIQRLNSALRQNGYAQQAQLEGTVDKKSGLFLS
jgi:hypothetical protein